MNYIYEVNEDNYLISKCLTDKNLKEGIILEYRHNKCVFMDKAWIDERNLTTHNLDGSFKYKIDGEQLIEIPFDDTVLLQERAKAQRKNKIVTEIRKVYDVNDEIAMIYKAEDDPKKIEYRAYVDSVKDLLDD